MGAGTRADLLRLRPAVANRPDFIRSRPRLLREGARTGILHEMSISRWAPGGGGGGERAALVRLPSRATGLRIGLFGGTFNPPHEGHRLASLLALSRLGLDRVWWLVTPGNPLKDTDRLPPLATRMEAARAISNHPRIDITGFEAEIGSRYTIDTIRWLKLRRPDARFVWIMGADNLAGFHRWRGWRDIARLMPIAVIDRPASTLRSTQGQAGLFLAPYRLREHEARDLVNHPAPAFVFLHGPRSEESSTRLRAADQNGPAANYSPPLG